MCHNAVSDVHSRRRLEVIDMPRKPSPLNRDDILRRYREGESIRALSRAYRTRATRIAEVLTAAGVQTSKTPNLPWGELIRRYEAGEGTRVLADEFGTTPLTVNKGLRKRGVVIRSRSEAEMVKWARMTDEERARQVEAAHKAARGRKARRESLVQAAKTIEGKGLHDSPQERELAELLLERGVQVRPQMAVGPYNCDLGAPPVAVEVFVGNWHWSGRHLRRLEKRVSEFFDNSMHLLVVWLAYEPYAVTPALAEYVAAYIESARRNPTAWSEYRVVRGDGETMTTARSDSDHWTLVPPPGIGAHVRG